MHPEKYRSIFTVTGLIVLLAVFLYKSFLFIPNAHHVILKETPDKNIEVYEFFNDSKDSKLIMKHDAKWLLAIFVLGTSNADVINAKEIKKIPVWIFALEGDDKIFGGEDNDLIIAGSGADTIDGHLSHDRVYPGQGKDLIIDANSEDKIYNRIAEDFVIKENISESTIDSEAFIEDEEMPENTSATIDHS